MIARYRFELLTEESVSSEKAYSIYGCLMELIPPEIADLLHEEGETPISQFVYTDRFSSKTFWQISLLGETIVPVLSTVLDALQELELNTGSMRCKLIEKNHQSAEEFILSARNTPVSRYATLYLRSPMAFKQSGRYAVLPSEALILHSLVAKWNSVFPNYPMEDEDALQMLQSKIRISDLNLRSTRFALKEHKLPGITGSLTFDAPLPAPIMEVWNLLLHFAEYSGIGIKTTLGMGGVALGKAK